MKRLTKSISFLFVALSIASCSKNKGGVDVIDDQGTRPFVDYEIKPAADGDPFTFDFVNKSSDYTKLEWRFGDDSLSTAESPQHLYLTTGTFEVNLKGTSENGATARKLLKVTIDPDSIVTINGAKTGVENELKFDISSKANLASALWTFHDNTTSTDISPVKVYDAGSFNPFSVTFTTEKGSVIKFNKFATTEGLAEDVTVSGVLTVSRENTGNANENSPKLVDNKTSTKWLAPSTVVFPIYADLRFESPRRIKIYQITSANDARERDPQQWDLLGSNDGQTWDLLDTRDEQFPTRFLTKFFTIANPKPYLFYRWFIKKNQGNNSLFQVAEWRVYQ